MTHDSTEMEAEVCVE